MIRLALVALAVLTTACAQPQPPSAPQPAPELGVAPTVADVEPSPVVSPSPPVPADAGQGEVDGGAQSSPDSPASPAPVQPSEDVAPTPGPTVGPTPSQSAGPAPDEPVVLLAVPDAAGDHGDRGPEWADLRSLELVEVGNDLRVTLRFGGALPSLPPEGEVPLIGVDIGDDGYQLFVEGGGESWAAYLDTPDGFVEYPGTFELAGRALVLQVPFSAVGSPTRAPVRAFAEWSRDTGTLGALNPATEDTLDGQPHAFDRTR